MSEYDKAVAEFLANKAPVVAPPVLDAKHAKELAKQSVVTRREREYYERIERNAENRRYDSEGVYYIGGQL